MIFFIILAGVSLSAHRIVTQYADYNHVVENGTFLNGRRGYLNVGLWSGETANFGDAQTAMYMLFFKLAGLDNPDLNVLETGCGTGEHYLLWKRHGMKSTITGYEISTLTHPDVLNNTGVRVMRKSALNLQSHATFDRIIAIESAFHYPNRSEFFKKCYTALKPGGVLLMADILVNRDSRETRWLQRCMQKYYEKCIFKIPRENAVDVGEYTQHLKACRFSSVRVVDITKDTLKPFYSDFYRNVHVGSSPLWVQGLYRRCIDSIALWTAFKYVLTVCVK